MRPDRPHSLWLAAGAGVTLALAWPLIAGVAEIVADAGDFSFAVLGSARPWVLLGRTALTAAGATLAAVLLGIPAARTLGAGRKLTDRPFLLAATTAILLCPSMVYAFAWTSWLPKDTPGWVAVAWTWSMACWPVAALVVGSAWASTGRAAYEAARLEAPPWKAFRHVGLPAVAPFLTLAALIVFLFCLLDYGVPHAFGMMVSATDVLAAAETSERTIDVLPAAIPGLLLGTGAAVLAVVSAAKALQYVARAFPRRMRIEGGDIARAEARGSGGGIVQAEARGSEHKSEHEHERSSKTHGKAHGPDSQDEQCAEPNDAPLSAEHGPVDAVERKRRRGHRRRQGTAWVFGLVGISWFLPVGTLLARSLSRDSLGPAITVYGRDFAWSIGTALGAGTAAALAALELSASRRLRRAALAAALGYAVMPGALLGMLLVSAYDRPGTAWIYDDWPILVICYALRYGWIAGGATLIAVSRGMDEMSDAAHVDGATRRSLFVRLVLPRYGAVIAAGIGVTAALSLGDVAASAMVRVPRFNPLAHLLIEKFHRFEDGMLAALSLMPVVAVTAACLAAAVISRPSQRSRPSVTRPDGGGDDYPHTAIRVQ